VFGAFCSDDFDVVCHAKTLPGFRRSKKIVQLWNHSNNRDGHITPCSDLLLGSAVKRGRQQDHPRYFINVSSRVFQDDFGAKRPPNQPGFRQRMWVNKVQCCPQVMSFVNTVTEMALRRSPRGTHSPKIEPEDGDIGECRQPPGRFPNHMRVHKTSRGGKRVTKHCRCYWRMGIGKSQLPYQGEGIRGVQRNVVTLGRKNCGGRNQHN